MKTPIEPDDPLLQSIVDDANVFSQAAAAQARSTRRTRTNTGRIVVTLAVLFLGIGIWFTRFASHRKATPDTIAGINSSVTAGPQKSAGYVKVYQAGEPAEPEPVPPEATERERQLLTELPDVPVLIVKNEAGQVARVHIFER